MCESRLVGLHLSRHENEAKELHPLSYDGDVSQRFLKDDIKVPMHMRIIRVSDPPKI